MITIERRKDIIHFYKEGKLMYSIGIENCLNKLLEVTK